MAEIKVLALDLDGTLTNSQKEVTPRTRAALDAAIAKGVTIVLASGRPTAGVLPLAKELGLDKKGGCILSYNGGKIIDCRTGETLYQKQLDAQYVPELCAFAAAQDVAILTYSSEGIVCERETDPWAAKETFTTKLPMIPVEDLARYVDYPVCKMLICLDPDRRDAVCAAGRQQFAGRMDLYPSSPFFIEAVPLGVAKDSSLAALLERMGLTVLLLAPTGRAAKRMSELCRREAQTIHRALGMTYNELTGETVFKKNGKEPLEADAVIVDEMSMVDLPLMQALLEAVKPGCRLVMVGDPDQLPSVGPGNVLGDLLRSHAVAAVSLTEVFRQAERSAIIRNAHAVNSGRPPELGSGQNDFFFLCRRAPDRLVQTGVDLCRTRLPDNMGIPADQIQVLSPTRRGLTGTVSLNRALQAALNPPAPDKHQKTWGELTFREGDRVMQTRNNYDVLWQKDDGEMGTGIFNGDVGIIQEIDPGGELVTIRFDDRTSVYTPDLLGQLDMAYAMTVHKAQGSEYRAVVLVSAPAAASLMVREVLYTAITRARELLVMVGDDVIPGKMAENDRQARRYSGLRRRLMQGGGSDGASG